MGTREKVIQLLQQKSSAKQLVYRTTKDAFNLLKEVLQEIVEDLKAEVEAKDSNVHVDYSEHGEFEVRMSFSGDTLVFIMHTNTFTFDPAHFVNQLPYVKKDPLAAFCGVIHIYNFLADSFRYHRFNDVGSLMGRLFINKDRHFFIEGDRQFSYQYNDFDKDVINKEVLHEMVCLSTLFSLEYDLYTPPFKMIDEISVGDIVQIQHENRSRTAKRLGFKNGVE